MTPQEIHDAIGAAVSALDKEITATRYLYGPWKTIRGMLLDMQTAEKAAEIAVQRQREIAAEQSQTSSGDAPTASATANQPS